MKNRLYPITESYFNARILPIILMMMPFEKPVQTLA